MKKILQSVAITATLVAANSASAQIVETCPSGIVLESYQPVPAYTGNHIYDMGTWDIDSILNTGTTVILDLFGTWCPPCWDYHEGHELNNFYTSIGQGGTQEIAIFAVDASTQANNFEYITTANSGQGDWIDGTKYPMVDNSALGSTFNISGFPTLIAICPDRTISEISRTSATTTNLTTVVGQCGGVATATNDPRILSDKSDASLYVCEETSTTGEIKVTIQNYSTSAINGSYTVKAYDASNAEVATTDVTLNLDPYETQDVTIGTVTMNVGNNSFTAKITTTNDELNNDEIAISTTVSEPTDLPIITNGFGANTIRIDVDLDSYASEFGMIFDDGLPEDMDGNTAIGLVNYGDASGSTHTETYTVSGLGCHTILFADSYGDGLFGGGATITGNNQEISVDGDWGGGTYVVLNLTDGGTPLTIEENTDLGLSVFPNPANEKVNVTLNVNETSNVNINVVNALGQTVYTEALGNINGENNVTINTTDLVEGIYFVNITVNGNTTTERISIVK